MTVTLKNGEQWSGVFHGSVPIAGLASSPATEHAREANPKYGVVLRMASRVAKDDSTVANEPPRELFLVNDSELVAVKYMLPKRATRGFQTDTEISAGANVNTDRQLTAFVHDEQAPASPQLSFSLNERSHEAGSWNQFEANQGMVNTSIPQYREDLYTTSLDRSSAHYKAKIAEAARIAAEIESGTTDNVHIAEERGQVDLHDDTMDEEDRYSMVLGNTGAAVPPRTKGGYVPPALRGQQGPASAGDAPPGLAKGAKAGTQPNNNGQAAGAPRSSSPRLSGLNLASDAASGSSGKAFTPYSSDPSKNPTPNPATRSEDTAKLRQTSTELDDKVKKTPAGDAGNAKKDMRAFMSANAWVAPTQRKGLEILDGMGMGSGSTSPSAASPTPAATSAPSFTPPAAAHHMSPPVAQQQQHHQAPQPHGIIPPHMQAAIQQHNAQQQQLLALQQQQHQHQQQQHQQHHQQEAAPPGSFASLLRADVIPRTATEVYREVLRDIISIEAKNDWERKQAFPPFAYPYGNNPAAYGFHPQAVPGAPLLVHNGHFVSPVNFVQPPFNQPHQ